MVEITEESTGPYDPSRPSQETSSSATQNNSSSSAPPVTLSQFVSANTADCCLNATRFLTVFFSICYLLPFLSPVAPESAYYKSFAAAAATNALRMHQRVGSVSLSREFLARLMLEDSCHYLFYCILFLTSAPVTMALLPITLFAGLHASTFAVKLTSSIGRSNSVTDKASRLIREHTANCLGIVACAEIFLIPMLISMIFVGKSSLFLPFVYYRFLTLRYASRRNPYTRQCMYQMRCSLEQVATSSSCPQPIRMLIHKSISFISGLAPAL